MKDKVRILPVSYMLAAIAVFIVTAVENAVPADELARAKKNVAAEIPMAPEGYRRPKDWKPVLYPKGLREIARDHSAETMARAAKQMAKVDAVNSAGKWKATGASIDGHKCPEWFVDAKLGIFIDWGPWSIASWCPYVKDARLYPDWYELRCRTDAATIAYHEKNWGVDFKSDHFLDLFRGTKFNAPALMSVFKKCGARYVVPFLKHHSGFCLWDCSYTFRDTVDMGAHRDFAREMADACRAEGLKFGIYDSQAGEWEYPILQDDGAVKIAVSSPNNLKPYSPDMEWKAFGKVAVKDFVRDYIVPQATEFIDKYDPDIFWGDYDWMTFAEANGSYDIVAYLYNHAEGRKEVATNDRLGKARPEEIEGRFTKRPRNWLRTVRGDFYTDEWGDTEECLDPAKWHPWESCSGISKAYGNHWMENVDPGMVMDERAFVIHFSDIVARGGNLLLLVNLDPQGEIPAVQKERLLQIGKWLERWGEAIYGTRILAPFCTKSVDYVQSKDGRFAYAIVKESAAEVTLSCALPEGAKVTVVGSNAPLATRREGTNTMVTIPGELAVSRVPFALKCSLRADMRKLVWSDEFNGAELDAKRWNRCRRGTSDWNRHMSTRPDLVEVKDGSLVLWGVANKDKDADPRPFLTGGVQSQHKGLMGIGKVEIRVKFEDHQKGAWPALWMLGDKPDAPLIRRAVPSCRLSLKAMSWRLSLYRSPLRSCAYRYSHGRKDADIACAAVE